MNNPLKANDTLRLYFAQASTGVQWPDLYADVIMHADGKHADVTVWRGDRVGAQYGVVVDIDDPIRNSLNRTLLKYGVDDKKITIYGDRNNISQSLPIEFAI